MKTTVLFLVLGMAGTAQAGQHCVNNAGLLNMYLMMPKTKQYLKDPEWAAYTPFFGHTKFGAGHPTGIKIEYKGQRKDVAKVCVDDTSKRIYVIDHHDGEIDGADIFSTAAAPAASARAMAANR